MTDQSDNEWLHGQAERLARRKRRKRRVRRRRIGAAPADAPYPELYVTRPDFHRQMIWLDDHGFQAVTLEAVENAWYRGGALPAKPVVISFDDGYRPQFTYALPELRRHAGPACSTSRRKAQTSTRATWKR
ncbi:MAG: hypothetical protein QOF13_688 [Solirubrobacterales bacterium]|jgi:peptidoglycan/xylan/chitin deacetylase (PgdA/CDA1 family)|nr:hypothetical protein [Solirubrobacterales bacterium]